MLDFSAFKKAQTAIHTVGQTGVEQRGFNHPALGVGAVQNGNFLLEKLGIQVRAAARELAHFVHHPLGLGKVAGGLHHPHRLTRALRGAQVFAQTVAVVANQVVGRVQNIAVAAVVLFQLDLVLHPKFAHKVGHVAHTGTPKGVNALVVVAHRKHRTTAFLAGCIAGVARQQLDPGVLQLVGVLKLVYQQMPKAPLVVAAHALVVAQQLIRAQQQLAKVHHAFALALVFVKLVNLYFFTGVRVLGGHSIGAQAVFFAARNKPLQLLGWKALLIHSKLLAQPFDGRQLVLGIQDLEGLRQIDRPVVRSQHAVAQAMEGAHPHAAHIDWQHAGQARHHFAGGLIGKRDGQHTAWRHLPRLQKPSNAGGQHTGLARTRPRQNQGVLRRQSHRGTLLLIERSQQFCHLRLHHHLAGQLVQPLPRRGQVFQQAEVVMAFYGLAHRHGFFAP